MFGSQGSPQKAVDQAESELRAAVKQGARLQRALAKEGQHKLEAAAEQLREKTLRVQELQESLELFTATVSRDVSPLRSLSKAQIAEVRQLARNPPEHVRRALTAVWLILQAEKYRGKSNVQLNEGRDWLLCQRMLADNSFVSRIQSFDAADLDDVPQLLLAVARSYFDFQDGSGSAASPDFDRDAISFAGGMQRSASEGSLHGPLARRMRWSGPGSPEKGSPSLHGHASPVLHTESSLSTLRKIGLSSSSRTKAAPKTALDVHEVQHASEPCGMLLKWLRGMVLERARRICLVRQLTNAEAELHVAEQAGLAAQQSIADLESEIAANQLKQARLEQAVITAREEPQRQPLWGGIRITDGLRSKSLAQRLRRPKPPSDVDMKITKTNLQNATWWRSIERFKIPVSPSKAMAGSFMDFW